MIMTTTSSKGSKRYRVNYAFQISIAPASHLGIELKKIRTSITYRQKTVCFHITTEISKFLIIPNYIQAIICNITDNVVRKIRASDNIPIGLHAQIFRWYVT